MSDYSQISSPIHEMNMYWHEKSIRDFTFTRNKTI